MLDVHLLTKYIEHCANNLVKNNITSNKTWTHEIKQCVVDFARSKDNNFCICVGDNSIMNADHGEWLYDLTIIKMHDNNHINYIDTIIESEWGDLVEIREDYQKLLQARSKNKLMICQDEKVSADQIINDLQNQTNAYSDFSNTDFITLLCWSNSEKNFIKKVLKKQHW